MFDTLRASQRLRDEGGFDERQAQAIVGAFADDMAPRLATKEDLDRLGERFEEQMERLEERLKHYVFVRVGVLMASLAALLLAAMAISTAILASS